jgi:hypothetical protein
LLCDRMWAVAAIMLRRILRSGPRKSAARYIVVFGHFLC